MKQLICCALEKPLFGLSKCVIENSIVSVNFKLTSLRTRTSSDYSTFMMRFLPCLTCLFLLFCMSMEPRSILSQLLPSFSGSKIFFTISSFFSSSSVVVGCDRPSVVSNFSVYGASLLSSCLAVGFLSPTFFSSAFGFAWVGALPFDY